MTATQHSTAARAFDHGNVAMFPTTRKRPYPTARLRRDKTPDNVRWLRPLPTPPEPLPPSPVFLALGAMAAAMEPEAFTRMVSALRAQAMEGSNEAWAALLIVTEGAGQ